MDRHNGSSLFSTGHRPFGPLPIKVNVADRPTDRPTDRRTDKVTDEGWCRVAQHATKKSVCHRKYNSFHLFTPQLAFV